MIILKLANSIKFFQQDEGQHSKKCEYKINSVLKTSPIFCSVGCFGHSSFIFGYHLIVRVLIWRLPRDNLGDNAERQLFLILQVYKVVIFYLAKWPHYLSSNLIFILFDNQKNKRQVVFTFHNWYILQWNLFKGLDPQMNQFFIQQLFFYLIKGRVLGFYHINQNHKEQIVQIPNQNTQYFFAVQSFPSKICFGNTPSSLTQIFKEFACYKAKNYKQMKLQWIWMKVQQIRSQSIIIAFIRGSDGMDHEKQLKIIINQILIAKGFYFLNYKILGQILTLLGKERSHYPAAIQQLALQGLIVVSQHEQKTIQRSFSVPQFQSISNWSKEFLKSIIKQVIATRNNLKKKASSESLARTMPKMNYTLLPYNSYPQMGFLNSPNTMGQNILSHGTYSFPPQIPIGYGHIYSQNLLNNSHEYKIKQQLEEGMQKLENSGLGEIIQRHIDNKEQIEQIMQDSQGKAIASQKIEQNQSKNHQEKNKSEQRKKEAQLSIRNVSISKGQNRKKDFCCFQIQTDLSLIFNALKIKKKKYILKKKLSTRIKRKYIRRKPGCYKKLQQPLPQKQGHQCKNNQMIYVEENAKEIEKNIEDIGKDQGKYLAIAAEMHELNHILENHQEQKEQNRFSNKMQIQGSNLQHSHHQLSQEATPFNRAINLDSSDHRFINENQLLKIDLFEINQHNEQYNTKNKFDKCVCYGLFYSVNIYICQKCNNNFHLECLMNKSHQVFYKIECPICKLRSIDPLQEVITVIGQFFVKDINSSKFSAKVDLSNYTHLLQQQEKNKHKRLQGKDIEIRCLKLEKNYQRSEITWPDQITIFVNRSKVTETYGLLLTSSNKKRVDQSIVITQQALKSQEDCSQSQTFQDVVIEMECKKLSREELQRKQIDNNHIYLFGIYYIQRVKVGDLYQNILDHITPFEKTYIQNLFDYAIDNEQMIVDFMTCKLRDPFSGQLMKLPVRGKDCTHPQCFDLKTFILLIWNSKSRLWRCPVCAKQAKQFRVDQKQLQMIKRCEQQKVIPEELIFMNKGDIIYIMQIKNQNEVIKNLIEENLEENQKEKNNPQKNVQIEKSYKYFEYFPNIEFLEVTFTSKECFKTRNLEKQRLLQQKKMQEVQQFNKRKIKTSKRGRKKMIQ